MNGHNSFDRNIMNAGREAKCFALRPTVAKVKTAASLAMFGTFAGCAIHSAEMREMRDLDSGTRWVWSAAEYDAMAYQTYKAAALALDSKIRDVSWTAFPPQRQSDISHLKPAIIFDVDETLVNNIEFRIQHEGAFKDSYLNDWNAKTVAVPVAGAVEFANLAASSGVELFFITNRQCDSGDESPFACPQQQVTVQDLAEIGIDAKRSHVMLARGKPDWSNEKITRRELVAEKHRIIMVFGDDLADFIPCVRARILDPCADGGSAEFRNSSVEDKMSYWGNGWYLLPNPMYGSWTTFDREEE